MGAPILTASPVGCQRGFAGAVPCHRGRRSWRRPGPVDAPGRGVRRFGSGPVGRIRLGSGRVGRIRLVADSRFYRLDRGRRRRGSDTRRPLRSDRRFGRLAPGVARRGGGCPGLACRAAAGRAALRRRRLAPRSRLALGCGRGIADRPDRLDRGRRDRLVRRRSVAPERRSRIQRQDVVTPAATAPDEHPESSRQPGDDRGRPNDQSSHQPLHPPCCGRAYHPTEPGETRPRPHPPEVRLL